MTGSPVWVALGWTMIHFLWAGAVVWIMAGCALRVLPRSSPMARYGAALGGLFVLAVLPVAIFRIQSADAGPGAAAGVPALGETLSGRAGSGSEAASAPSPERTPAPVSRAEQSGSSWPRAFAVFVAWLPWVWGLGTSMMLALLACGGAGVRRLAVGAHRLEPGPWAALLEKLRQRAGVGRAVAIAASDRILTPLVTGILRPLILVPAGMLTGWTPAEVEMVLLHELAHVRRCDNLVNFVQRLVEALLFFHPAVWALSRRVRQEREACCDDAALAGGGRRREYAALLFRLVPAEAAGLAASAFSGSDVLIRIRRILRQESPMPRLQRVLALAGATAGVLLLVVAARAQVQEPDSSPPPASPPRMARPPAPPVALHWLPATGPGSVHPAAAEGCPATGACPRSTDAGAAAGKCTDCHANPHVAQAWQLAVHASMAGQDCSQCHADIHAAPKKLWTKNWTMASPAQKRAWGPEQACGAPDTPEAGDHPTAWASETPDSQDEWLELRYAQPVEAVALEIRESHNPGAVRRVVAFDAGGAEVEIWSGTARLPDGVQSWAAVIPFEKAVTTDRIRIEIASSQVPGWNEIDAVGLRTAAGRVHWAKEARATSTYADVDENVSLYFPLRSIKTGDAETERLKRELKDTQDRLADALRRLAELERRLQGPR